MMLSLVTFIAGFFFGVLAVVFLISFAEISYKRRMGQYLEDDLGALGDLDAPEKALSHAPRRQSVGGR